MTTGTTDENFLLPGYATNDTATTENGQVDDDYSDDDSGLF